RGLEPAAEDLLDDDAARRDEPPHLLARRGRGAGGGEPAADDPLRHGYATGAWWSPRVARSAAMLASSTSADGSRCPPIAVPTEMTSVVLPIRRITTPSSRVRPSFSRTVAITARASSPPCTVTRRGSNEAISDPASPPKRSTSSFEDI